MSYVHISKIYVNDTERPHFAVAVAVVLSFNPFLNNLIHYDLKNEYERVKALRWRALYLTCSSGAV